MNSLYKRYLALAVISAFSFFSSSALATEIVKFSAIVSANSSVTLHWTTANETNNHGFEILHSANGLEWDLIDFVYGNGSTNKKIDYEYKDEKPFDGKNYYRLNQLDNNGKMILSEIRTIEFESGAHIKLFPNPTLQKLTIVYENYKSAGLLQILDSDGNTVLSNEISETTTLSLDNLKSGVYMVELKLENSTSKQTVIKL